MMNQLCLFEQDYLNELKPVKHWKYNTQVVVYYDRYLINRRGQVYDTKKCRYSKTQINGTGYLQVDIQHDGKHYKPYLHRLVACTFIKCIDKIKYNQVNHIDSNKLNPHFLNLEWVTHSENMKHIHKIDDNQLEMF